MRKLSFLFVFVLLLACGATSGKVDGMYVCDTNFYSSAFNQEKKLSSNVELKTLNDSVINIDLVNAIDTLNFQCKYKNNGKSVLLWIIPKTENDIEILSNDSSKHDAEIVDNTLTMNVKKSILIQDDESPVVVEWVLLYDLKGKKIK